MTLTAEILRALIAPGTRVVHAEQGAAEVVRIGHDGSVVIRRPDGSAGACDWRCLRRAGGAP